MASSSSTREIYFDMADGEKILCHPSLNFLSGFLKDYIKTDPDGTDPIGIPSENKIEKAEIELLNKFVEHLDTNHRERISNEQDRKEFWMEFIVSTLDFVCFEV